GALLQRAAGLPVGRLLQEPPVVRELSLPIRGRTRAPAPVRLRPRLPDDRDDRLRLHRLEHFQFAVDLRYVDYRDTNGFGPTGFDAAGALRGLGWRSMFVAAAGVQY